jgi:hypothetical protein
VTQGDAQRLFAPPGFCVSAPRGASTDERWNAMSRNGSHPVQRLLTAPQAAERLGLAPGTLRDVRVRRRLKLRAVRVGRSLRFSEEALARVVRPEEEPK